MPSTSIKTKILLLLLTITCVVVIVMALLMQFGFKQGFNQYKKSLEKDLNDRMVVALQTHYAESQSWQLFAENPQSWHELIFSSATSRSHGNDRPQKHLRTTPPRKRHNRQPPPGSKNRNLKRARNPELSRVLPSYSLFNQQQQRVIGQVEWDDENTRKVSINHSGQVVGYVAYSDLPGPGRKQDQQFNAMFIKLLIMITAVMILVALLFTVPVAKYFTQPISALNRATQKAAQGDFSIRTHIDRKDELGQLGQNFNLLTSTLASNADVQKKMMADIAHELRTPVAVLQAEIEAIQDGIHQADDKNLGLLHQQIVSLGRLIGDLHQLSVADLGSMQYQMQAVDLLSILAATKDAQQLALAEKHIELKHDDFNQGPLMVLGDPNRLQQLFSNLISNSIAYTDEGGRIELSISSDEVKHEYIIGIADSEPGLLPHEMEQMFNRLYRKEESRNKKSGGSGLGLAIAKNIVAAHNGQIHATASKLGGISMTVRIPQHA